MLGLLTVSVVGLAGCSDDGDTNGDGVDGNEDPAPNDPRVDAYVGGDPPPSFVLEPVTDVDDPPALRIVYQSGNSFTADDTDRVELATGGEPITTLELPLRPGDSRLVESVPVDTPLDLVWFGTDGQAGLLAKTHLSERLTAE